MSFQLNFLAVLMSAASFAGAQTDLRTVKGDVAVQNGGAGGWIPASTGRAVSEKDVIRTGAGGKAVLRLSGGTKVLLRAATTAALDSSRELRVLSGDAEAWVKSPLGVATPVSRADFRSAVLRVRVDASGASVWDVFETAGMVRVHGRSGSVKLAAGGHAGIDRNGAASPAEFVSTSVERTEEPKD